MADLNTLKTDAGTIRDASLPNENTASRIGSWLIGLIEFLTSATAKSVITSIVPSVTADGIVLTLNYQKDDGSTFSNTITLPLADATKAGLMSPTMVAKISSLQSSINAINTKNAEQDNSIASLQGAVSTGNQKNATQDSQIQGLTELVETNRTDIENATKKADDNRTDISTLQGNVSTNAADIDALQKSTVANKQELSAQIEANNLHINNVEQHCNERQGVCDTKNEEQDKNLENLDKIDEQILIRLDEMQLSIDSLTQRVKYLEDTFVPRPVD